MFIKEKSNFSLKSLSSPGYPPQQEIIEGDIKKIISYEDRDEKVVKVTRFYKLTKLKVPKPIADRKKWKKFGDCSSDGPGINPANSMVRAHQGVAFVL